MDKDQALLASLLTRYAPELETTYSLVLERLRSEAIGPIDVRDLVYRHGLAFFAALDALDCRPSEGARVACGAILCYSIPLILIDTRLDTVHDPEQDERYGQEISDPCSMELLTHIGYRDIALGAGSLDAVQLTASTSAAVIMAMQQDARRRGDLAQLSVSQQFIESYWTSPASRLNGSGVGRLMLGLASILADGKFADDRIEVAAALGKLRQLEDELMDVVEDVSSGLVTLPVAYSLLHGGVSTQLEQLIRGLWLAAANGITFRANDNLRLRRLVMQGEGHLKVIRRADVLLDNAIRLTMRSFPKFEPIKALLLHRRYQMDRAVANNLADSSPVTSVDDLLRQYL